MKRLNTMELLSTVTTSNCTLSTTKRINLIVGRNESGKTTLLKAIWNNQIVEICDRKRIYHSSWGEDSYPALCFDDSIALDLVRLLTPTAQFFDYFQTKVCLIAEGAGYPTPVSELGTGHKQLLLIASALSSSKDRILCLDDMGICLHRDLFHPLWHQIARIVVEQDIQLFTTTHNTDCCVGIGQLASELDSDLIAVHRISRNKREATTFDQSLLTRRFKESA